MIGVSQTSVNFESFLIPVYLLPMKKRKYASIVKERGEPTRKMNILTTSRAIVSIPIEDRQWSLVTPEQSHQGHGMYIESYTQPKSRSK